MEIAIGAAFFVFVILTTKLVINLSKRFFKGIKQIFQTTIQSTPRYTQKLVLASTKTVKLGSHGLTATGKYINHSTRKNINSRIDPYFSELDSLTSDIVTLLAKIDAKIFVLELFELQRKQKQFERSVVNLRRHHRQVGTTTLYRRQNEIEAILKELVDEGTDLLGEAITVLQTQLENTKEPEPCKNA